MQESIFVWAKKDSGEFDETQMPRQSLWLCRVKGKITLHQHGSTLFTRITTLSKTVSGPDYDKIDGLRVLAREQRWERYGSIKFGNLIDNLVKLVRHYQTLQPPSEQPLSLRAPPPPMEDARMRLRYTEEYTGVPANRHGHVYDRDTAGEDPQYYRNLDRDNRRERYSMQRNEKRRYERGSSQYDRNHRIHYSGNGLRLDETHREYWNEVRDYEENEVCRNRKHPETRNQSLLPGQCNNRQQNYKDRSPRRDDGRTSNGQYDMRNPYDNRGNYSHEGSQPNSAQYQGCVLLSRNQFVHRINRASIRQNPSSRRKSCSPPVSTTYEVTSNESGENTYVNDLPNSTVTQAPNNTNSTDRAGDKRRCPEDDDWYNMTRAQKRRAEQEKGKQFDKPSTGDGS